MTFYDLFEREQGQMLLRYSSLGLLVSTSIFLLSIALCYPFAAYFPLGVQLAGHLLMLAAGVLIKITYLLRCVAQHALHREVG